jgi:hypothetical protein
LEEIGMKYETFLGIDIAGIRRGIKIVFEYHVETIDGIKQAVHDSVYFLLDKSRVSAQWIYQFLGERQLDQLQGRLLEHSKSKKTA